MRILALAFTINMLAALPLIPAGAAETGPNFANSKIEIPDAEYLAKLCNQMLREERGDSRVARDMLVAYVRDISKSDLSRAFAVDLLTAVKSEENLKILASFLTDRSAGVRTRAFYGLPEEVHMKIEGYDYTANPTPKDFAPKLAKIYRLIEEYCHAKKGGDHA